MPIATDWENNMNKRNILTAAAAGGILVYCITKILRKRKKEAKVMNHKTRKHVTKAFVAAKAKKRRMEA